MTNRQDSNPQKEPLRDLSPSPLSRLASAITALRHNQDLLRNAGSLIATTGITSVLGFAYWIYAARVFSTGAVGYASAAISTMILLGTIGMFGLDTLLIGELPRGGNRGGLTMASCIAAFLVSFVLGVGFCLVSLAFGTHFVEVNGTIGRMAVFSFGVAITGATTVFDSATIGLMRGGIQLYRNAALSVAKMVALPVVAFVLNDRFGVGIMLSWVLGTVISLIPVAITIWRGGGRILHRPDWNSLWRLRKLAMAHNWLNLAMNIPLKLIPVLVALVVVPSANGAYYIATLVASFLTMVPYSLSQVLFAVASAAPERIPEKLRFVLRMSLVIGLPGGLVMGLSAHLILSAFGSSYAALATGPLWILIIGYIPGIPNTVYIAVARAQGRFNQAAIFLTVFAALRMAALVAGAKVDGLYGLSYGMLGVTLVQALITTPAVLRPAFGSTQVRSATGPATVDRPRVRSAQPARDARLRQEAGLAALVSLASLVAVNVTGANPLLTDTNWWPAIPDADEAAYRAQQEKGMAALIGIARSAGSFNPQRSRGARQYIRPRFQARDTSHPELAEHDLPFT